MTFVKKFDKDPSAVRDYTGNWRLWLAPGDSIVSSTVVAETGLTVDSESNTADTTTVWLSGGTLGSQYLVTTHVVTAGGREDDRSILIDIKER